MARGRIKFFAYRDGLPDMRLGSILAVFDDEVVPVPTHAALMLPTGRIRVLNKSRAFSQFNTEVQYITMLKQMLNCIDDKYWLTEKGEIVSVLIEKDLRVVVLEQDGLLKISASARHSNEWIPVGAVQKVVLTVAMEQALFDVSHQIYKDFYKFQDFCKNSMFAAYLKAVAVVTTRLKTGTIAAAERSLAFGNARNKLVKAYEKLNTVHTVTP